MANYSLRCGDCKKEYNIETVDEDLLPSSAMKCRFCKSKKMGLIEFYLNDKARIEHLSREVEALLERAENIEELDFDSQDFRDLLLLN